MQRAVVLALLVVGLAVGGLYYYFAGREYVYRFSDAQLQQALSDRMPIEKSYFLIFRVNLDNPRVTLPEGSDRVVAGLDVTLNILVGDEPLPLGGSLDASGGIRYDDAKGEFFLTDPVVERFEVQGVPEVYAARVTGILTTALAEFYAARPIYTLSNLDPTQAAAHLVLKSVVVERRELVVTLGVGA
jgi:hypothetical protein